MSFKAYRENLFDKFHTVKACTTFLKRDLQWFSFILKPFEVFMINVVYSILYIKITLVNREGFVEVF